MSTIEPPEEVDLIGYGALGRSLVPALQRGGVQRIRIGARPGSASEVQAEKDGLQSFSLTDPGSLAPWLLLAVSDGAVEEVAQRLAENADGTSGKPEGPLERIQLAAHFSGRLGVGVLAPLAEKGVPAAALHPMQTFPGDGDGQRFQGVVAGLTAEQAGEFEARRLAALLGMEVMEVPEELRNQYHLASVLVSNFLPLLLKLGAGQLAGIAGGEEKAQRALLPLMQGMLESLEAHAPVQAMSGPVVRDDLQTVGEHLELPLEEETRSLYIHLTKALARMAAAGERIRPERLEIWLDHLRQHETDNEQRRE